MLVLVLVAVVVDVMGGGGAGAGCSGHACGAGAGCRGHAWVVVVLVHGGGCATRLSFTSSYIAC